MFSNLSSLLRSGMLSAALLAFLPQMTATAAPLGPAVQPAVPDYSAIKAIPVWQGEGRDGSFRRIWPRVQGGRHWNGGSRGAGNWNGGWRGRGWNGNWNGRHWGNRGNWDGNGWGWGSGSGLALGLGFGGPVVYYGGYYGGYYDNYDDPYYNGYYDEPVYRPRVYRPRVYRDRSYYNNRSYDTQGTRPQCDNEYMSGPRFMGCR